MTAAPVSPERICLVRLSALGDVCLTVPLVRSLQRSFPKAQITWVTTAPMLHLLEGLEGVEFVIVEKANPFAYVSFYRQMRGRKFDVLLAAQASFRAHFLYPAIRAPLKIGFHPDEARDSHRWFVNQHLPGKREHLLDSFLGFARALGAKPVLEWRLPITDADNRFAEERLRSQPGAWIALNPLASKPERNWVPKRYAAVIDACIERWNCNVVLTGGPGKVSASLGESLACNASKPDRVLNLVGKTTPKQLAALLKRVKLLIAPDTGPVHIATAVGTPVVGLYAVASSRLSGPYLSQHLVVDRYPDAVRAILGKDPERVPWKTRVKSPRAMELIAVDDVLAKVELVFKGEQ
ncbi:MAG: glycosyltransferase family 9 protein [Verrucomicrobia subdivision 3 bacterium]|nr:glycosyltransferase family 9 protein [Limisphaerales bacterium]